MARAIWSGAISFGLVNVPVKLYPAISRKEVRFHMLHQKDGARIQMRRFCSAEEQEVPYEEIVKGFEVSRQRYVTLEREELAALDPRATRSIDIEDFVELTQIDPIYFESTYYLIPEKGAARAYALLLHAMERSGRVAIGRVVLRTKQYLCTIRPMAGGLALSTMNYADEIVSAGDLGLPAVTASELKPREQEMAEQLVQSLSTDFDPARYRDEHRARVLELVERKAAGEQIVAAPEPEEAPKVVNLIDALEKSLAAARMGPATAPGAPPARGERRRPEAAPAAAHRRRGRTKRSGRGD